MKLRGNKKKTYLFIGGALLLLVAIGYAYLSTTLNITGQSKIEKTTWDIHFENIIVKEGSITPTTQVAITNNSTQVDFSINLKAPGEFYEFTVDVVNAGSIDAMVSDVIVGGITSEQAAYIEYKVTYADEAAISEKDLLSAGKKVTLKFMIKFKDDVISSQLPTEDQTLNLAFKVTYIQADRNEAKAVSLKSWTASSTDDFHNSTYKENIVKASFVDYIDLSKAVTLTNGTGSNYWELSDNQKDGIIGWLEVDSADSTKYQLYIGTNGNPLYANVDSSFIFNRFGTLKEIQFQNFNTSNVTNMEGMFNNCSSLTSLDVSNFNTSNATTMQRMFSYCRTLTSLNLSNFNTSNATTMQNMFYNCNSLTSLNLSNFDTSNVTYMKSMFSYCNSLTSLNLSNFNTSNVTDMTSMFSSCSSLTSLNLSNFNTSNVIGMGWMFLDCSSLTSLDLSSFDMSKVTSKGNMLSGTSKISTAYARTAADAAILNDGTSKPATYTFVVKA